jgi:rhamnosyltransferase
VRIAGITVLYQPDISVLDNINSYIENVDRLYVFDNSERYNDCLISALLRHEKIQYVDMHGNQGLAKALACGCRLAKADGFKYVLTMDQDSKFEADAVDKLKNCMKSHTEYSIIGANAKSLNNNGEVLYMRITGVPIREVYWNMTSGSLMNLDDYFEVGGFDDELFIGGIDIDIGIKMHIKNKRIGVLEDAVLLQHFGNSEERNFFGKKVYVYFGNDINYYYYNRNDMYLRKKYGKKIWKKTGVSLLKSTVKTVLYETNRIHKIKIVLLGYKDGYCGNIGKKEGKH